MLRIRSTCLDITVYFQITVFAMWVQLEFDFSERKSPGNKRNDIDYAQLYEVIKKRPMTFREIQEYTGLNKTGTAQCITTLTLRYPVWSPARGLYKVCEESDYTTVDWSKLYVE